MTDYGWERVEIDDTAGESIDKCISGTDLVAFWVTVGILGLIPILLTEIMAWKTIDVDAVYSESKWIFALILVHFQVSQYISHANYVRSAVFLCSNTAAISGSPSWGTLGGNSSGCINQWPLH